MKTAAMTSTPRSAKPSQPRVATLRRREGGTALLAAMMMLILMGMIGLASLDTVMQDRQVAGHTSQARQALYAAEAGVARGLDVVRTASLGATLSPGECISQEIPSYTFPESGASYQRDTTADGPISGNPEYNVCMLATADPCAVMDSSIEQGQQIFLNTVWDLRVEGRSQGGAVSRLQATVARCHAFNN